MEQINLHGVDFLAVFDSGSNGCAVTSAAFRKLGKLTTIASKDKFRLINGSEVKIKKRVESDVTYRKYNEEF